MSHSDVRMLEMWSNACCSCSPVPAASVGTKLGPRASFCCSISWQDQTYCSFTSLWHLKHIPVITSLPPKGKKVKAKNTRDNEPRLIRGNKVGDTNGWLLILSAAGGCHSAEKTFSGQRLIEQWPGCVLAIASQSHWWLEQCKRDDLDVRYGSVFFPALR